MCAKRSAKRMRWLTRSTGMGCSSAAISATARLSASARRRAGSSESEAQRAVGYYVRVLSTSADCVPLTSLRSALQKHGSQATLSQDENSAPDNWTQLTLSHNAGPEIAAIERNIVEDGSLGAEELAEFADEIAGCQPASAMKWLLGFFPRVRCIYAFQVLSGTDHANGWEILGTVKNHIWSFAPSILQADNEGFSNEDGYHILWQFSDAVDGLWWMGVLREGSWQHFQMDLGNREQRSAFLQGNVPGSVKLA